MDDQLTGRHDHPADAPAAAAIENRSGATKPDIAGEIAYPCPERITTLGAIETHNDRGRFLARHAPKALRQIANPGRGAATARRGKERDLVRRDDRAHPELPGLPGDHVAIDPFPAAARFRDNRWGNIEQKKKKKRNNDTTMARMHLDRGEA
jgi:hypothetical protein